MKSKNVLTKRIIRKYLLTMLVSLAVLILIPLFFKMIFSTKVWHGDELFYPILYALNRTLVLWLIAIPFITWFMVTYFFFKANVSYLDEVLSATKNMIENPNEAIILSDALSEVEEEINQLRTDNLRNKQVAKEAEKRKNDLVVYLAHDLRTPLTSIIGYLSLLQRGKDEHLDQDTKYEYIDVSREKAYRLEELINEFFEITKINLGEEKLNQEKVDLSLMTDQIAHEFLPSLSEKELAWELNISEGIQANVDIKKFQRVIDNLIKNALSYAPPRTTLYLALVETDQNIVLSIKNKSEEMSTEVLEKLFDPFYRVDHSRRTETGNSGLGLSITKGIVESHGGTIKATYQEDFFEILIHLPLLAK